MSSPVFEVRVVGNSLALEEVDEENKGDALDVVITRGHEEASFLLTRDDVKTLARALRDWLS